MASIQILHDDVINKIAAGEVVERPASVLKELIENAIDAGSTQVSIELEEGGIQLISVQDNGCGIAAHELSLAVQRHATSKISSWEHLYSIQTLGFRGEALAAISSVAKVCLDSKPKNQESGYRLEMEDGHLADPVPFPMEDGTKVLVKDLFYNIPVRKEFLKSPQSEYAQCLELVQALALAYPHVGLRLFHNKTEKLNLSPCSFTIEDLQPEDPMIPQLLKERLVATFQDESLSKLVPFTGEGAYGRVIGLASPPGVQMPTGKHLLTFVNGRWVKDKILRYGITRGYHSHLLKGKYPQVLLYLFCEPSLVDVNVHPSKTEVRFQYPGEVQGLIGMGIRGALRGGEWVAPEPISPEPASPARRVLGDSPELARRVLGELRSWSPSAVPWEKPAAQFSPKPSSLREVSEGIEWEKLSYIGTFASCYLLFQQGEKMLALDQHAFHERILYEQFKNKQQEVVRSQPLLIPERFDLSVKEVQILKELKQVLESMGFGLNIVHESQVEVTGLPLLLVKKKTADLLQDLLKLNPADGKDIATYLSHDLLATLACHSAVRKGEELPPRSIKALIDQAGTVDFYHNCPHGRRVFKWFSLKEVEGWFDRV